MKYFIDLIKKFAKSMMTSIILISALWGILYNLTDFDTIVFYIKLGAAVCFFNTMLFNLQQRRFAKLLHVKFHWIIMAGVVLVLYHAGFEVAAVFAAAAILASPFFWATPYESIVGISLLALLFRLSA